MATLCSERYLTREEMKTQYQKTEKRKNKMRKHKYRFSVLTSKRKIHFDTLSSTPWNKLAIV